MSAQMQASAIDWMTDNERFLSLRLQRIRLMLKRRALWLRSRWREEPSLQPYQSWVISDAQADWLLSDPALRDELHFYSDDREARLVGDALQILEHDLEEHVTAMSEAGAPPALQILAGQLGLGAAECEILALCLAPELDPGFERLYAYAQDDPNRRYATLHLAEALLHPLDGTGSETRDAVSPEGTLRRLRLVTVEDAPGTAVGARPLILDERVAQFLRGIDHPDPRVLHVVSPLSAAPLTLEQSELVERLENALRAVRAETLWPVVELIGRPDTGKRAVAVALCERFNLSIYRLEIDRIPSAASERVALLHLLEREAMLSRFALYVHGEDIDWGEKDIVRSFRVVVERLGVILIVGGREPVPFERDRISVRMPAPDAAARRDLWRQSIPEALRDPAQMDDLVQQFDFGPSTIVHVAQDARRRAQLRVSEAEATSPRFEDVWESCQRHASADLSALAQRIEPCFEWNDIVLPDDVRAHLKEVAAQATRRAKVYETWGFGRSLSRGRGISALFAGPSGTGKTMAAEILANHLKLDLYRIDLAGVVSKYIGETEKNLRKIFDAAEQSGAILFFDEADALFGKRTEVKDSHDRYANIEINYLLQRMEDYRGLAILASNRRSELDQAFLRRLRFLISFPFPDRESRRRIWAKSIPRQAEVQELALGALARLDIAGGNIKNIVVNGAFLAASEGTAIGMNHLMRAARREYAKIDKMTSEADFGEYYIAPRARDRRGGKTQGS